MTPADGGLYSCAFAMTSVSSIGAPTVGKGIGIHGAKYPSGAVKHAHSSRRSSAGRDGHSERPSAHSLTIEGDVLTLSHHIYRIKELLPAGLLQAPTAHSWAVNNSMFLRAVQCWACKKDQSGHCCLLALG